ncbi:MAG: MATE family efflux transporter [Dehalococcoidales bacterium]|nr:MAG: MATE family efflux transporter [Dehalococcoidales bacterium]
MFSRKELLTKDYDDIDIKEDTRSYQFTGGRFDRDWTQGGILKNLLSLSWPMVVTNTIMMLGPTIDMIWVGKLGQAAIAGVGVSGMAVMLLNSMMMGLAQGMRAVISRFVGARNFDGASHAARQAFVICAVFSSFMAIIGMFFAEGILVLLGLEPEVVVEGAVYLRILFVASVSMSFRMLIESIMQASGDTVSPMKMTLGFRIIHVILCPFLIFGWWIFPEMGVSGAALTNVIAQSIGTAIGIWYLFSGRTRIKVTLANFRIDLTMIWRIVRIGIPALVSGLQRGATQMIIMWFVVPFGTAAVAAHSLNQRIEIMMLMPTFALGMASGVLAGQNLGAGQPDRAAKSSWIAVALVEGIMFVFCMVIIFAAEHIVHIFSTEPDVVQISATYLRIGILGYAFLGFVAVLMNSLSGSGDTLPPMIVAVSTVMVVTLPMAFFLSKYTSLGVYGVRWAMAAEMVVQAIIFTIYFRTGKWKTKYV